MLLPTLRTARLTLRPLTSGDLEPLAAIVRSQTVSEWWGRAGSEAEMRRDLENDGRAFALEIEGRCSGWLGFEEERHPDYRHASLDIVLAAGAQNRGLGPEALRAALDWLIAARGHHRFTIDPALANDRAIRAYESVGFRPVGVLRSYERGPDGTWHDNLLMDLLAAELPPPR
ncbi:MAG: GNAT family protein [Solirubrobacteraceae bacterium]